MSDTIGRSIIEVGADASNLEAGMAAAARSVEGFEKKAVKSADGVSQAFNETQKEVGASTEKLDATTKRFLKSLERETDQVGRTRGEYLQLRAAKMGVSDQAGPMIQRLLQQEAAQRAAAEAAKAEAAAIKEATRAKQGASIAFNEYGLSAKQTTAALRQVPAQLTDIVVSLQGGQAPLTVLLQQGGQLKDVFGGVVPAVRALGGAIGGLLTPLNVALAAIGALGLTYFQGSQQINEFNRALISSGNAAGITSSQLALIASQTGAIAGAYGTAREAAAALAETGTITGNDLTTALRGVTAGVTVTKRDVGDLVREFAAIGKDPIKAITELNLKYNFLTADIYNQIRALQDQGRAQEAATLAIRTFADTLESRQGRVIENLGYIERAWKNIKTAIGGAIEDAQAFGRQQTDDRALTQAQNRLRSLQQSAGPGGGAPGSRIAALVAEAQQEVNNIERRIGAQARVAEFEGRAARDRQAAFDAERRINEEIDKGKTKREQLSDALSKYRKDLEAIRAANPGSTALLPANIAAAEAAIRNRFRESSRQPTVDAGTRLLENLRQQEQSIRAQVEADDKLTTSQQKLAQFAQQIADIKEKRIRTADEKSLLANEQSIRAQFDKNIAVEVELANKVKTTKEMERQQKLMDQMVERSRQLSLTIEQANAGRATQNEQRLAGFGRGGRAQEEIRAQLQIQQEFKRYRDQLTKATPAELLGSDQYNTAVAEIQSGLQAALTEHESYYARLRLLESDWVNGSNQALQNYIDQASNTAATTERIFSDAFKGLEDVLTNFVMTGKLSFEDLSRSIVASVTRAIIQAQIVAPLAQALQGSIGGGGGGFFGNILGSLFAPGRAAGGPVLAGGMYEVNESMPELLNFKGREYLMMGNTSGQVKPLSDVSQGSGGRAPIIVNVQATPNMSRSTAMQQGSTIGQGIRNSMMRNT
jgi:lambda family phage tail tape measure protein